MRRLRGLADLFRLEGRIPAGRNRKQAMWNNENWTNKSLSLQVLLISVFTCGCGKADKQGLLSLDPQQAGSLENTKSEIRETDRPLVISVSDRNRANRPSSNWPQWRGPSRTDISNESGLLRQWPGGDAGPKQLWVSHDAGIGYSGPAVVDGVLYTMGALPLSASGLEEQGGEDAVAEAKGICDCDGYRGGRVALVF